MARISIKDLPQDEELDREALRSILGGGSSGPPPSRAEAGNGKQRPIVDYPPGCSGLAPKRPQR